MRCYVPLKLTLCATRWQGDETTDQNYSGERCLACGEPTRAVPMRHRDGSVTYSGECTNRQCPSGPSGIFSIRTRRGDAGQVASSTNFSDTAHWQHAADGDPSENESNVEHVAHAFMDAANRQYGTLYDKYIPGPNGPSSARDERGFDCKITSSSKGYSLKMQVTRVLPGHIYCDQRHLHLRQISGTTCMAADWIMGAVQRKEMHASRDVALVLDGVDAPFLAILTDIVVSTQNEADLARQGWHSIWVVGPAGVRRLAGQEIPGYGA